MSRNLGRSDCDWCSGKVTMTEPVRSITESDCGAYYFTEYHGMLVAKACCEDCEAPYLAWVLGANGHHPHRHNLDENEHVVRDLSFWSTFNDEPGPEDFPKYFITRDPVRRPWTLQDAERCGRHMYLSGADQERLKSESPAPPMVPVILTETRESDIQNIARALLIANPAIGYASAQVVASTIDNRHLGGSQMQLLQLEADPIARAFWLAESFVRVCVARNQKRGK